MLKPSSLSGSRSKLIFCVLIAVVIFAGGQVLNDPRIDLGRQQSVPGNRLPAQSTPPQGVAPPPTSPPPQRSAPAQASGPVQATPIATATLRAELAATNPYVTAPADLPRISVTKTGETAPGAIFLANFRAPLVPYLMILDNDGKLVYYNEQAQGADIVDFKKLDTGELTYFDGANSVHIVMNASYEIVDSWSMVGYKTGVHDLQILPNGNAVMMAYHNITEDLSAYGGVSNTVVVDTVLQELNPAKQVVFEWKAWDHIAITDTYISLTSTPPVDVFHGNSVEIDWDGNLLLSNRHTASIVKINRQSGKVMWTLGGKSNEFRFVNDTGFSYQHDARRQSNGRITLFDNGNLRPDFARSPQFSRAVEYEIDEANMVITRTGEYRDTPDIFGGFMGNVQRLPGGGNFIGWGGPTSIGSEVTPLGQEAQELWFDQAKFGLVYRWFKFPWVGKPVTTPTLALKGGTLHFSWNGATEIVSYRVEGARTAAGSFTQIGTAIRAGFETSTTLRADNRMCVFRVMPIDRKASDTRYSNAVFDQASPDCQGQ